MLHSMVTSQLIPLPALSDNYIWLLQQGSNAVIIDPGEHTVVQRHLEQHGLTLQAILLTHHHGDHVGGALALHEASGAPVYGPATERLPVCHHRLSEGDTVQLPDFGLTLNVLDVPGHTAGHIAYYGRPHNGAPMLFCGDTLFAAGCGRLFEGTPAQMLASLGKFAALPDDTLVCCAHEYTLSNLRWALAVEPDNASLQERWKNDSALREKGLPTLPSTLALERATNPFLRTAQPAVAQSAARHAGQPLASEVDVFASLREWKNNF
ncbi:MAG TPA: hydroxyacylglutathione hydrolase [Burkholderiaceae bacterium]|nr:hydroxyacylglutathione hydrolase [bacterium SGD-2]HZH57103.1 hydroxyacylglutathione hydrolase [Burkholderiaceae bacterium]